MNSDESIDVPEQAGTDGDFSLISKLAELSAMAVGADAAAAEAEDVANAVRHSIAQAEASLRLRGAVQLAGNRDATAMNALRLAVCEFTFAHRSKGFTPESVLIALKKLIEDRAMPPIPAHETDWNGERLRENISTWCIKAYFDSNGACA